MDALDVRILRTMGLQPYGRLPRSPETLTARHVAKALGVSPETARERIQRMERDGIIDGYELFPNLRLLGLGATSYLVQVRDPRQLEGIEERLAPFEGLLGVYTFLGGTMCVTFAHRGDADRERRLRLMRTLVGPAEWRVFAPIEAPEGARAPSPLDWRILLALRGRPRRNLAEVAAQLKVSARTVKRRLDRMAEEGAFFVIPVVDPAKAPGLILFEFVFELETGAGPRLARSIEEALDEHLVCTDGAPGQPGTCYGAGLYAQAIGEVETLRRRVAALPGVKGVQPLVLASSVERFDWLGDAMAEAAAAAKPGARPARATLAPR